MKKFFVATLIVLICACALFAGASAPANITSAWILLPETPIYASPSLDAEVLHVCAQNEGVVIIGEATENGKTWKKVRYLNAVEGYVTEDALYYTSRSTLENIKVVKISPTKMGAKVGLYKIVTEDPVLELSDGENVYLLESAADYGDFSIIEYNGEQYFVKTNEITDSLTYNQKVAIIIAAALIGVLISFFTIIILYKKKKMNR